MEQIFSVLEAMLDQWYRFECRCNRRSGNVDVVRPSIAEVVSNVK